jgi:O-antigen ligase
MAAVIVPKFAFIDLPRRFALFGLTERLAGITPHPNLLSATAAVAMLLSMHLRRHAAFASVACVVTIALAESREGALGLVAALVIYWVYQRGPSGARLVVAVPAAIGVLAAAIQASSDFASPASALTADASTLNSRTVIWHDALQFFAQKPTLGWGPFAFADDANTPFSRVFFLNAHNQFLQGLVEGGVIGLAAVTFLAITLISIGWRHRATPVYPALAAFTLLMMLTEVPFTIHLYGLSYVLVVAWLFLAVAAAAARLDADSWVPVAERAIPSTDDDVATTTRRLGFE